jgi:serine/threonine protein kinase
LRAAHKGAELPEAKRLSLLLQLARALSYLHTRTPIVVHRDVKPLNALLDRARDVCKLTDFGISRTAQTMMSKMATVNVGTASETPATCLFVPFALIL